MGLGRRGDERLRGVPVDSPWQGWINAEVYDLFVREHGIYRALNRRLAELAEIAAARRVLDLACGAGATALACLAQLPADGELWGVDGSAAMVAVARAQVRDPRARFAVAAAAAIEEAVAGPFDRAVCNAALWQFPALPPVLAAVARLLVPGGLFAFNVPAERLAGEESPVHPFQVALARAIERKTHRPFSPSATSLDPERLGEWLAEAGFAPPKRERFTYRGPQGELMDLTEIPAMIEPMTPGLTAADRRAVLRQARRRTDPQEVVEVPWIYFVARRRGAGQPVAAPPGPPR
jgi:ubiquinone/menaquinone biosynthesis C-methylase UbiE